MLSTTCLFHIEFKGINPVTENAVMTEHSIEQTKEANFFVDPIANTGAAKWSYFSLVFSVFYFFNIIASYDRFSQNELLVAFAIYAAFIVLFFQATKLSGKAVVRPIVAIIILSAVGASINPGTNALFGYAAFFTGYYFIRRHAIILLVFNIAAQLSSAVALDLVTPYYLGPSMACTLSLMVYGIFSQKEYIHVCIQRKKNQQIEQLAAIAERERIARDMHDLLGHSLSSLALKSELAEKLADKQQFDAAKKEMAAVAELARQTLSEVRYAVTGLKQKGLRGSLEKLSNELQHMGFEIQSFVDETNLSPMTESTLIMISKEWITNILRHSNGKSVSIAVNADSEYVRLNIGDNGIATNITPGNGIEGMRTRVEELGGTLEISRQDGVKLAVSIPLTHNSMTLDTQQEPA
jgi:two-component system, NarL family, sensor histidine kinase DesK